MSPACAGAAPKAHSTTATAKVCVSVFMAWSPLAGLKRVFASYPLSSLLTTRPRCQVSVTGDAIQDSCLFEAKFPLHILGQLRVAGPQLRQLPAPRPVTE